MIAWDKAFRGAARTIFSLLVAAVFLTVLMVASAQQEAASHLDPGVSFSAGRKLVKAAQTARADMDKKKAHLETLGSNARSIARDISRLEDMRVNSLAKITLIAQGMVRSKSCPDIDATTKLEGAALWGVVYQCWNESQVTESERKAISILVDPANDPTKIARAIKDAAIEQNSNAADIETTKGEIAVLQSAIAAAAKAETSLEDISVLDDSFVGALGLTGIPPVILQILLCFVSGLFGALLITLILIVYPKNKLTFTGSTSYWNRIFLGGLIAVGVFVVIGGGVAVLSSTNGLLDGSTNFLSFCAIGLLAGMFSDKFAGWLSKNADKLTSPDNSGDEAANDRADKDDEDDGADAADRNAQGDEGDKDAEAGKEGKDQGGG